MRLHTNNYCLHNTIRFLRHNRAIYVKLGKFKRTLLWVEWILGRKSLTVILNEVKNPLEESVSVKK